MSPESNRPTPGCRDAPPSGRLDACGFSKPGSRWNTRLNSASLPDSRRSTNLPRPTVYRATTEYERRNMSGPLDGVVVPDFTQLLQGPYTTQILGDMGAEILKIEPPGGDWMRKFALGNLYLAGESVSFLAFNRNKRSVCVNLKHAAGGDAIKQLAARADVVIENFRPGVMDRLGLG